MMHSTLTRTERLLELDEASLHQYVVAYVSNPLFRAATFDELVLADPYRRPVRPDDLSFVRFAGSLAREDHSALNALLAHRMLFSIYDAATAAPPLAGAPAGSYAAFQDHETRVLGELVRPFLERHVFGTLDDSASAAPHADTGAALDAVVSALDACAQRIAGVIASLDDPEEAWRLFGLQCLAQTVDPPRVPHAASPVLDRVAQQAAADAHAFARARGLHGASHAYWQFYLPSWMALRNYAASGIAAEPYAGGVGAAAAWRCFAGAACAALALAAGGNGLGPDRRIALRDVLDDVVQRYGAEAGPQLLAGARRFVTLARTAERSFAEHVRWADRFDTFVHWAGRIQAAIAEQGRVVDLETYVESCEECSTTHVHDTDRLLVIESGTMDFWNSFGKRRRFVPGDVFFIPKHRLHGSVVLSGRCVYHQPIIPPDLMRSTEPQTHFAQTPA